MIGGLTAYLLRRHVADRAKDGTRHRGRSHGRGFQPCQAALPRGVARQTEIENLHAAGRREKHIVRLQITVRDLFIVCDRQSSGDLRGDIDRLSNRQWSACDTRAQCLALEQLHHGVWMAVAVPDVEDRQDVGMRKGRNRVRFSLEPRQRFRIVRDGGRNDLDRDVTIQTRIARAIDLAHATRSERRQDRVRSERLPSGE